MFIFLYTYKNIINDGKIYNGKVLFYNWKRGFGRVSLENDDEEHLDGNGEILNYYFQRDDIVTGDKVILEVDACVYHCIISFQHIDMYFAYIDISLCLLLASPILF